MIECKIDRDGNKRWLKNGKRHKEDGPAIEWQNGDKSWYIDGLRHRDDGPAIVHANGYTCWFVNGKEYSHDEFVMLQFSKGIITNG